MDLFHKKNESSLTKLGQGGSRRSSVYMSIAAAGKTTSRGGGVYMSIAAAGEKSISAFRCNSFGRSTTDQSKSSS